MSDELEATIEKENEVTEDAPTENEDTLAVQQIAVHLAGLTETVAQLTADVAQLSERLTLIPPHVRQLGQKVDELTESISQPRVREMLGNFLLLYDLVTQMQTGETADLANGYRVLHDQISQILRVNGIYPITDTKQFDPALHKAVETIPCQTPEESNQIEHLYRPGFRTDHAILRYAEVIVKRYTEVE